jgi:hypothetical protein
MTTIRITTGCREPGCLAPEPGYLWTPGYWAWGGNAYIFHVGYWGPRVGFYGGINYGYGYFGRGYDGGRWDRGRFYYNRSVNNINVTEIHNVYNTTIVNRSVTRVSYNGGSGGIRERANAREEAAARERHMGAIAAQNQQVQEARSNRGLRASENHGKPPIAATQRPGAFNGGGVVAAREGGRYNPPPNRGAGDRGGVHNNERPNAENNAVRANGGNNSNRPNYVHPNELPQANRSDRPPSSGNPKTDQKYQQQQDRMYQKQQQDRQKLQQRQDQEHQKLAQRQVNDPRRQQVEQHHQQQTQKMEQRHTEQQQKMQQKQQPRPQQQQQRPGGGKPHDKP